MYFRLKYTRIPNLKNLRSALAYLGLEFGFSIIFSAWIQLKFVTFQTRLKKSNIQAQLDKSQLVGTTSILPNAT